MNQKITLKGKSGQGVQLLGFVLANYLKDNGYQLALTSEYGALVRAGESKVSLVIAKQKIINPLVEKADFEYDLRDENLQKKLRGLYDNLKVLNTVLLGLVLKKIGLDLNLKIIKKNLPKKFIKENTKAIKSGYEAKGVSGKKTA